MSESNQRPTDYKSVALPAELKWHIKCPPSSFVLAQDITAVETIKNYPLFKGEAKVREIENWKNFEKDFFACFQQVVNK